LALAGAPYDVGHLGTATHVDFQYGALVVSGKVGPHSHEAALDMEADLRHLALFERDWQSLDLLRLQFY
jgi:hypothetical protein